MRTSLIAAALLACSPRIEGGTCGEDSDCAAEETCLVDLDRDTSYCTRRCDSSRDCPAHQSCRIGVVDATSGARETRLCVDTVRACGTVELCNGLDDDCDGVVDEEGCELVTRCLDDVPCGGFVCQAPENQPSTVCAPPNTSAISSDFEACTSDAECRNAACEAGFCSPFCRPDANDCELAAGRLLLCAQALGASGRPKHNVCHAPCMTSRDCTDPAECVWRPVFQAEPNHLRVCSLLDPSKKPLGTMCPDNRPDGGDAECRHGLCYEQVCTRTCGGFGASCADLGPDFACAQRRLFYDDREFAEFVCVRSP